MSAEQMNLMTAFFEKWFNWYNDVSHSDFPFRMPPPDVKFTHASIFLRGLATIVLCLVLGNITAVLTILVMYFRSWYPYLASGQQSIVQIINTSASYTFKHYGAFLFFDVPILALVLFLLISPRYYYWNRRADRLNQASGSASAAPESDSGIWPPPPSI